MKITEAVKKETFHVAVGTTVLSTVMICVFLLLGKYDSTVLYGALIGTFTAIINFFFLGLTVQKMVEVPENRAKTIFQFSYLIRTLVQAGIGVLGFILPFLNGLTVAIPLLFPSLVIRVINILYKGKERGET